jgi:hypothetical protein
MRGVPSLGPAAVPVLAIAVQTAATSDSSANGEVLCSASVHTLAGVRWSGSKIGSAKFGHEVEHYAEMTVPWLLFGAVVGTAVGGSGAAIAPRFVKRRRLA